MAGPENEAEKREERALSGDDVRRLVAADVRLHNQLSIAAKAWEVAPPENHAADQWERHKWVMHALAVMLQHAAEVNAILSGTGRVGLRALALTRPLRDLATQIADLQDGTVGPLLRPRPVGGTKAPTKGDWERRALIAAAVEMAHHAGLTYPQASEHVAALLPQKPRAQWVVWVRKQVLNRARTVAMLAQSSMLYRLGRQPVLRHPPIHSAKRKCSAITPELTPGWAVDCGAFR